KVCALVGVRKKPANSYNIFMGEARWCGHDSRGNPTHRTLPGGEVKLLDEVPEIARRYAEWKESPLSFTADHRGFELASDLVLNRIFVPRYYNPEIKAEINRLSGDYDFVTIGQLAKQQAISISRGIEIGKMSYGTGTIPFIRT